MLDSRLAHPSRAYRWFVVFFLWMICVLNYADRQAIFSVFSILEKTYGFNKKELGMIGSAFMIVYAGLSPLAGYVGDRLHRKWIIIAGLTTWSGFTVATGLCSRLSHFILVRGAEGLGETFYFPASTSLISDYHPAKSRSRALGFHQTGTYVGTIVGGVVTGWLAEAYGWTSPFVVFGVAGLVLAAVLIVMLREVDRGAAEPTPKFINGASAEVRPHLRQFMDELIRNRPLFTLLVVYVLANVVTLPFYAWLPLYFAERFDLGVAKAAFAGTFFLQGSSAIGAVIGGIAADRWHRRNPAGRVFSQALGVLGYAPLLVLASRTSHYKVCVLSLCVLGIFKGIYDANVWPSFYDLVAPSHRGTFCGLANTLAWVGGSCSVFLVGFVVDAELLVMSQVLSWLPALNVLMFCGLARAGRKLMRTRSTEY